MKVVYNNCFGGFGLSPEALTEYAAKKGITLTWYEGQGKYPYAHFTRVEDVTSAEVRNTLFGATPITEDLGARVDSLPADMYYDQWDAWEDRTDPDLIEVVERLGNKANAACASLAIVEIPDGAQFEITEYDGNESVEPIRMSWEESVR